MNLGLSGPHQEMNLHYWWGRKWLEKLGLEGRSERMEKEGWREQARGGPPSRWW
jgi:hypothetical protein